jgi:predicted enzyme related to lactoylglutathione lyase
MRVLGVGWVGIISDRAETHRFYREVLGLQLLEEDSDFAYYRVSDEARLEILAPGSPQADRIRWEVMVGFLVEDLPVAVKQLETSGHPPEGPIVGWPADSPVHRWAHFVDPDGRRFLLLERKEG